jgi:hypothetical protein
LKPVALRKPGGEASARRGEPRAQLRVERGDLIAELKEIEVEAAFVVTDVLAGGGAGEGCAALRTRLVGGLWPGTEHRYLLKRRDLAGVGEETFKLS